MGGAFLFADVPFSPTDGLDITAFPGTRAHGSQAKAPAYSTLPQVNYDSAGLIFFASAAASWKKTWFSSLSFSQGSARLPSTKAPCSATKAKPFMCPTQSQTGKPRLARVGGPPALAGTRNLRRSLRFRIYDIILRRKTLAGTGSIDGKECRGKLTTATKAGLPVLKVPSNGG
jgi:hypothetical protein